MRRGLAPTFVFESRFTTYPKLSRLNAEGVRFITLRRRGKRLLERTSALQPVDDIARSDPIRPSGTFLFRRSHQVRGRLRAAHQSPRRLIKLFRVERS